MYTRRCALYGPALTLEEGRGMSFFPRAGSDTPLINACRFARIADVTALLQSGANVNEPETDHGYASVLFGQAVTPLFIASQEGHPDVVSALLDAGLKADVPHEYDRLTPLWRCTWMDGGSGQSHHYEAAARLVENGADPNYIVPEGLHDHPGEAHTPLQGHLCVVQRQGQSDAANLL